MTRERRLAIEMWERIAEHIGDPDFGIYKFKRRFCVEHNVCWESNCWFCQYVRKNHRHNLSSRVRIGLRTNGCQNCPIYKYNKCEKDECGCTINRKTLYFTVCGVNGWTSEVERKEIR